MGIICRRNIMGSALGRRAWIFHNRICFSYVNRYSYMELNTSSRPFIRYRLDRFCNAGAFANNTAVISSFDIRRSDRFTFFCRSAVLFITCNNILYVLARRKNEKREQPLKIIRLWKY